MKITININQSGRSESVLTNESGEGKTLWWK